MMKQVEKKTTETGNRQQRQNATKRIVRHSLPTPSGKKMERNRQGNAYV